MYVPAKSHVNIEIDRHTRLLQRCGVGPVPFSGELLSSQARARAVKLCRLIAG